MFFPRILGQKRFPSISKLSRQFSSFSIINPFNNKVILEDKYTFFPEFNASGKYDSVKLRSSIEDVTMEMKASQLHWANTSLADRIKVISLFIDYFKMNQNSIARDISLQMGKPLNHALGEIKGLNQRSRAFMELAHDELSPEIIEDSADFHRAVYKEPKGIALTLAPWNYPLLTAVNSVVPALLTGNAVLLSHGPSCFLSSIAFKEAVNFGLDEVFGKESFQYKHLVKPFTIEWEYMGHIIEHVDTFSFTGSTTKGIEVEEMVAKATEYNGKFLQATLELGGCDGAYVSDQLTTEGVKNAVDIALDGAFFNAGQGCCSIERVFVHEAVYDEFKKQVDEEVSTLFTTGDPLSESTTLGPLAKEENVYKLKEIVEKARSRGDEIVGANLDGSSQNHFSPVVVFGRDPSDWDPSVELFGPIVFVYKVKDESEATQWINHSNYGLTASIFTSDLEQAKRMGSNLNVGTVFMNRADYLDPYLPWQGRKLTGKGCSLSKHGFSAFYDRKNFHFKLN